VAYSDAVAVGAVVAVAVAAAAVDGGEVKRAVGGSCGSRGGGVLAARAVGGVGYVEAGVA